MGSSRRLEMKIEETPIKDRFNDLLEKVMLIRTSLEDNPEDDLYHLESVVFNATNDLNIVFSRLSRLRDHVLRLTKEEKIGG